MEDDLNFPGLVQKHFAYLVEEYGYQITDEKDWRVAYQSAACQVVVWREAGRVLVYVYPPAGLTPKPRWGLAPPPTRFDLGDIINFKDGDANYKGLFMGYGPAKVDVIDAELGKLARLLRQYGDDLLQGDFSKQQELEQFVKQRQQRPSR